MRNLSEHEGGMSFSDQESLFAAHIPYRVIEDAAEQAYKIIANREGAPLDEVHSQGNCHKVTSDMRRRLSDIGYDVEREIRHDRALGDHSYLTLDISEDEIIIDPTWQQFLPSARVSSELPKILIGTRDEVKSQARNFGVRNEVLRLWERRAFKFTERHENLLRKKEDI